MNEHFSDHTKKDLIESIDLVSQTLWNDFWSTFVKRIYL